MNPVFTGDGTSQLMVGWFVSPPAPHQLAPPRQRAAAVCTDGVGLVGTRDGHTVVLRAGDSVWTPAGEEHFHGGTADNMMCHYAILDAAGDAEATTWLEPVTEQQYTAAHTAAQV